MARVPRLTPWTPAFAGVTITLCATSIHFRSDIKRGSKMPTFIYDALTDIGHSVNGEVVADHERAALRELKRRGLVPLSLALAAQAKRRRLVWRRQANLEDHIRLLNEIAVLIEAGVNLNEAVEIAYRSPVYQIFDHALINLGRDLRRGLSITEALHTDLATFTPYVYKLIAAEI